MPAIAGIGGRIAPEWAPGFDWNQWADWIGISARDGLESLGGLLRNMQWIPNGPPLHVRSLTKTSDQSTILAAVHVGGIPRSHDGGKTWQPTLPIMHDVHEVRAHHALPNFVAAAAAVGLCISIDGGNTWRVYAESIEEPHALAVAVLSDEVLFSVQDGPFAKRAQIWRWTLRNQSLEQVRDGLPDWLAGKVDTGYLAAKDGQGRWQMAAEIFGTRRADHDVGNALLSASTTFSIF